MKTYVPKMSMAASTAIISGGSVGHTWSGTYNSLYDQTPTLAALAGNFTGFGGSTKAGGNFSLSINPSGGVTGSDASGCTFSGTAAPHATGNSYDVSITFGGAPCVYPAQTVTGFAVLNGLSLYAGAQLSDKSDAFALLGTKH